MTERCSSGMLRRNGSLEKTVAGTEEGRLCKEDKEDLVQSQEVEGKGIRGGGGMERERK